MHHMYCFFKCVCVLRVKSSSCLEVNKKCFPCSLCCQLAFRSNSDVYRLHHDLLRSWLNLQDQFEFSDLCANLHKADATSSDCHGICPRRRTFGSTQARRLQEGVLSRFRVQWPAVFCRPEGQEACWTAPRWRGQCVSFPVTESRKTKTLARGGVLGVAGEYYGFGQARNANKDFVKFLDDQIP